MRIGATSVTLAMREGGSRCARGVAGPQDRPGPRSSAPRGSERARQAVRLARSYLQDALTDKITLNDLATHAGLDKFFRLVRVLRAGSGTAVRVSDPRTGREGSGSRFSAARGRGRCPGRRVL
jgi:hypothetical protein